MLQPSHSLVPLTIAHFIYTEHQLYDIL